ncbi:S-adenosyl-L-methionine-dependent methyltransferase [Gloeopeniophorella convolvens]|nr:S-adenosyl-L-methionine-dependent methyltransferase [Gloeopeniophorella convolvens]
MNFYFEAAKVIDRLDAKHGSIKSLLSTLPDKDHKRSAALVIETLKYKSALTEVIKAANLMKEEKKLTSMNLALVLVHDLLLSNGIQAGDGPVKQAVLRHKTRLRSELQRVKIKRGAKSNSELAQADDERAAQIPRYVRINALKWSVDEAIPTFQAKGYALGNPLDAMKFARDSHIENLLLFPPQAQFTESPDYAAGRLILQDKASCFPAVALAPPALPESVVIDATAAPGNKTSHLSALMGNQGKILAFERDRKRYGTLKAMLARAGCSNVEALNADFLTTNVHDNKFAGVTHILLDPSCSGSGIVNRLDYLVESEAEKDDARTERLAKLAAFQLQMIRHAMKYPAVERIVYSTCSINPEENERVVHAALQSAEATGGGFELAPRAAVLPAWPRRGQPGILDSTAATESVVRCSPGEDATNGFFVSCFVRKHRNTRPSAARAELAAEVGTGRNSAPTAQPTAGSSKRKTDAERVVDGNSVPLTSGGKRKKRK